MWVFKYVSLSTTSLDHTIALFLSSFPGSSQPSAVFSGGAGGARAPPEFGGSGKGRSLISAFWSLAITTNTPGFKKLNTALLRGIIFG